MSKYRLKKDWLAAGEHYLILRAGLEFEECGPFYIHKGSKYQFLKSVVEKESDWFEEIKEPERIEVTRLQHDTLKGNGNDTFWYRFCSTQLIHIEKVQRVKQAIEGALNDKPQDVYLNLNLKHNPFIYTEEDVKDALAFLQRRQYQSNGYDESIRIAGHIFAHWKSNRDS